MNDTHLNCSSCCGRVSRRDLLTRCGMGFTGLVLSTLFHRDGFAASEAAASEWRLPDGKPHFPPKAKSVIWIFFQGGMSHLETFDPKPALNRYGGKTIEETPYKHVLESPLIKKN